MAGIVPNGESRPPRSGPPGRNEFLVVVLGAFLAASIAYLTMVSSPADPDMFWHIATGREIVETGSIPQHDGLSWYGVENGLKITTQEWLFGLGLYGLHASSGFGLIYAVAAVFFGAIFVATYALTRLKTERHLPSLIVATTAMLGMLTTAAPRPQSVSYLLLVLAAILLERKHWLAVLPIMIVVANVHGGTYPIFIALIAYYAYRERPWLIALAIAAVLLNPQGFYLLTYPLRALGDPTSRYVQEMAAPSLSTSWFLLATIAVLALVLRHRKVPRDTGLFALAVVAMSLASVRFGAYVYLLVVPLLSPYLFAQPTAAKEVGGTAVAAREPRTAPRWLRILLAFELVLATAAIAVLAARAQLDVDDGYPRAASEYVREHRLARVFNMYQEGGYLMMAGVPPLIDGRAHPFTPVVNQGEDLFARYADTIYLKRDYERLLEEESIEYLLLPKDIPLYQVLSRDERATVLYEDPTHAVFRVRVPPE